MDNFNAQDAFRAVLDHQGHLRKLLEEMILELRLLQDISKQVAVLETRLSAVERFQVQMMDECKQCRGLINGKFSGIQQQYHEDTKASLQAHQRIQNDFQKEVKTLDERIDFLEKKAAELGGRYGVLGSITTVIVLEVLRWFIHSIKQ